MSEQSFRWKLRDQRDELLDVLQQWAWAEAHDDNAELTNAGKARDALLMEATMSSLNELGIIPECDIARADELARQRAEIEVLKAELREVTEAIDDPAINNVITLADAVRALKAECDALRDELREATEAMDDPEVNNQRTLAWSIRMLRADAERYRWLRDMDEDPVMFLAAQYTDCNGSAISISIRIDAAIDAAREKK